jgi:hypothetical protein
MLEQLMDNKFRLISTGAAASDSCVAHVDSWIIVSKIRVQCCCCIVIAVIVFTSSSNNNRSTWQEEIQPAAAAAEHEDDPKPAAEIEQTCCEDNPES